MNPIHRIRSAIRLLAALASALLVFGAAAPALATSLRPPPGSQQPPPAPPLTRIHPVVTGGMPGWQITLIAVAAALAAATLAVLLDRARAARREAVKPA
jgi:hypothetical protein